MTIDWNKPIEAVHEDGRVISLEPNKAHWPDSEGDYATCSPNGVPGLWGPNGNPWFQISASKGWRVRNVGAEPDELTALRAFKTMALERYPDLEPKPETDWEAANRFEQEYYQDRHGDMSDMIFAAIAWARANQRNTETKED